MKSKKPVNETKSNYQPKADEMEAFKSHFLKRKKQLAPRIKVEGTANQTTLSYEVLLMEALGTADYDFFSGLLQQLSNGSSRGGKVDEKLLNFMLAVDQRN
jgi:hypothetical protein